MKKLQYVLGMGISLLMVGCMESPTISQNNTHIVKLNNGKQYKIPVGAVYTQDAVTPQAINFYKVMGVSNCKNGDITWEDPIVADRINKIMRGGTKQEGITMYVEAAKEGTIGCSSPIK